MLFILMLHVNFYAFGKPSALDFTETPASSIFRVFLESLTIVGVNCFILISGWFGIRPKAKRVLELLFQCVFFCCLLYGFGLAFGIPFEHKAALKNLFLAGKLNWFIKSYLTLYILSPVLEAFVGSASKRTFATVVISFFVFQSIYGWLFPVAEFFNHGYSAVSFIGLYLLARYARIYPPQIAGMGKHADLLAYILLSILTTFMSALTTMHGVMLSVDWFAYCSPLVVASALFMFLFFNKLRYRSAIIDTLGASSYAVYLFHVHPCVFRPLLIPLVTYVLTSPQKTHGLISIFFIMTILLACLFASILLDQIRIVFWKKLVRMAGKLRLGAFK